MKQGDEHGSRIMNSLYYKRPTKITKAKRLGFWEIVDKNPFKKSLTLLSLDLVVLVLAKLSLSLAFLNNCEEDTFLKTWAKVKAQGICIEAKTMEFAECRRVVFINEATIEYDSCPHGKKVSMQLSKNLYKKNLNPSFKLQKTNVGIFCALREGATWDWYKGGVRKNAEVLATNWTQCFPICNDRHKPHVIPFI